MINRFGKYVFENGEIYEGNWREGKMHGRGRLEWFDSVYEGDFEYGLRTGNGTLRYTSDQTYTGAWKTGRPRMYCNADHLSSDRDLVLTGVLHRWPRYLDLRQR
jgi:hypothetical protein